MKSQRSVTGPQVILSLNGDAPIALRRKSVSDRGFVSTASHFIHVKIASKNLCAAPVEKVVHNRADPTFSNQYNHEVCAQRRRSVSS